VSAGTCSYCSCTETHACDGGCTWADDTQTLCSACAPAVETATELVHVLGIVLPDGGLRLSTPRFDALPLEQQTFLVLRCRELVESIRAGLAEASIRTSRRRRSRVGCDGRSRRSMVRAHALGLEKTEAYRASPAACRLRRVGSEHPGRATQYPKGHVPANKGCAVLAGARAA
jgi:hypothetical protein